MILSQLAFSWLPDNPQSWIFETVGIVASLLVFASFFWSNEKVTRMVNMVGCVVFVVYAILIQSLSVCIINGACFILHVVKLVQMYNRAKKAKNEQSQKGEQPAQTQKEQADLSADESAKE